MSNDSYDYSVRVHFEDIFKRLKKLEEAVFWPASVVTRVDWHKEYADLRKIRDAEVAKLQAELDATNMALKEAQAMCREASAFMASRHVCDALCFQRNGGGRCGK